MVEVGSSRDDESMVMHLVARCERFVRLTMDELDVAMQYRLPGHNEAGLRLNYGSGCRTRTPPPSSWPSKPTWRRAATAFPRPTSDDSETPPYIVPSDRNRERYPAYQRLDLTFRRTYQRR
jgi:hypothetical protein